MPKISAGFLLYRIRNGDVETLLVHPGGPFWANKHNGSWSIPKGELCDGEDPFGAAKREVEEELGFLPEGKFLPLDPVTQKSGKVVHAWAVEADWDTKNLKSNTLTVEWPPRSGVQIEVPEVDRAEYFSASQAEGKINPAQMALIRQLEDLLRS